MILDVEFTIAVKTQFNWSASAKANLGQCTAGVKEQVDRWLRQRGDDLGNGAFIQSLVMEREQELVEYSTNISTVHYDATAAKL